MDHREKFKIMNQNAQQSQSRPKDPSLPYIPCKSINFKKISEFLEPNS